VQYAIEMGIGGNGKQIYDLPHVRYSLARGLRLGAVNLLRSE